MYDGVYLNFYHFVSKIAQYMFIVEFLEAQRRVASNIRQFLKKFHFRGVNHNVQFFFNAEISLFRIHCWLIYQYCELN
jgi:hypothetical protein